MKRGWRFSLRPFQAYPLSYPCYATAGPTIQHTYKSTVLAPGLPSYPPDPQATAQHGAVIAILAAVRRPPAAGGRARAFCMRGRRDTMLHWRPGHFVRADARRHPSRD